VLILHKRASELSNREREAEGAEEEVGPGGDRTEVAGTNVAEVTGKYNGITT